MLLIQLLIFIETKALLTYSPFIIVYITIKYISKIYIFHIYKEKEYILTSMEKW